MATDSYQQHRSPTQTQTQTTPLPPNKRSGEIDPELERLFQDIKRLNNGISAVEDRLMRYLARK